MFLFKKPVVTVDCFTDRLNVYEYSKIDRAGKFVPEKWRQLPKTYTKDFYELPTMRKCQGFLELYKTGLMIPMWSDLAVKFNSDYSYEWQFSDQESQAEFHGDEQRGGMLSDPYHPHMKIISPWRIMEPNGVKWHTSNCFWNAQSTDSFVTASGMVEFKYQTATHINVFFSPQVISKQILIKFGTPMMHLVPLTEKRLLLKHHLVTPQEMEHMKSRQRKISFINSYKTIKHLKEKTCK